MKDKSGTVLYPSCHNSAARHAAYPLGSRKPDGQR